LRHDATHGNLPSMDLLKTAADWCIKWLKVKCLSYCVKPETSDQPDRETCTLKCHYL